MSTTGPQPETPRARREAYARHLSAAILAIDHAAETTDPLEAELEVSWAIADLQNALGFVDSAPAALADLWGDPSGGSSTP